MDRRGFGGRSKRMGSASARAFGAYAVIATWTKAISQLTRQVSAPVQILQFMVLDETIGIAVVMVALRDTSSAGIILRKYQLAFSHMRGVAAH